MLPRDFPPFTTVQYYFYLMRDSGVLDALNDALVVYHGQILGRDLAVWRADDGFVNVWENRCLHRGVRLSIGSNSGEDLKCQYHGWRYANRTAGCTYIPAHPTYAPARTICNRTFPVVERFGLIWSGEAPKGDLPEIRELEGGSPFALRPIPVNAPLGIVVQHLKNYTFKAHGDWVRPERCVRLPRHLGMNVQMRLAAFARVCDLSYLLACGNIVPDRDPQRTLPKMAKKDVDALASQEHVVARRIVVVHLGDRHVGVAPFGENDLTRAGRENGRPEDHVAGGIWGHDPAGAQAPAVHSNQIDAIARPAKARVQGTLTSLSNISSATRLVMGCLISLKKTSLALICIHNGTFNRFISPDFPT
jgi:nitrite reductase/ring-hydroxylating ferredoxin subunit